MKFYYSDKITNNTVLPVYYLEEKSFCNFQSCCDYDVLIGNSYVSLGVRADSNEIISFEGYCPKESWIERPVSLPSNAAVGSVIADVKDPLIGSAVEYNRTWNIYSDTDKQILFIGEFSSDLYSNVIKINDGIYMSLRDNALIGVWISYKYYKQID